MHRIRKSRQLYDKIREQKQKIQKKIYIYIYNKIVFYIYLDVVYFWCKLWEYDRIVGMIEYTIV